MSVKAVATILVMCLVLCAGFGIGVWLHIDKLNSNVDGLLKENERLTSCAQRQIRSLLKICGKNRILVAQGSETSEWFELPAVQPPAE